VQKIIVLCDNENLMISCLLFIEKWFVLKYCLYLLLEGYTPLHSAAWKGHTDVTTVLLEAEASLSTVNNHVPVPSQGHYGFHSFPVVD
jgi:hypothetical protein